MEPSEYDNIARVQERHWWYRGMAAISLRLLGNARVIATRVIVAGCASVAVRPERLKSLLRSPPILDAGCGPGGMLTHLATVGRPIGIDLHPLALAHARAAHPAPLARATVERLPFADGCFDIVTSFDVLYHLSVGDDVAALKEFARVLRSEGILLIRVPALEALRGAHDAVVHTRHRYTAGELRAKLRAAGFQIERLTYANTVLFFPVLIRRLTKAKHGEQESSDVELPPSFINSALEFVLQVESLWLTRFDLPVGVSLFALARVAASRSKWHIADSE
jgi:SAM-dependent methyltransferase